MSGTQRKVVAAGLALAALQLAIPPWRNQRGSFRPIPTYSPVWEDELWRSANMDVSRLVVQLLLTAAIIGAAVLLLAPRSGQDSATASSRP